MELKIRHTNRGFKIADFVDRYGEKCSIQESSLATEAAIWLGVHDPKPQVLIHTVGWVDVPLPANATCHGRMHLTQEQVASLLPLLQHFVETGYLPESEE